MLFRSHVLHGGDRLAYSWTLLEVAEFADGPARFSTASGLLSSSWRLEDRIAGILDDGRDLMTRSNRRASLLVAAGFVAATAGFATLAPAGDGPADKTEVSGAVDRMADKLRQGPLDRPADDEERAGLYLLDLADGKSTLITAEPEPGLRNCGSPRWSPDGRRILFDASPGKNWRETHLKSIDLGDDRLKVADLGPGNCPSFAPDGGRVAFLSNSRQPGRPLGIWIMRADGSERRPLNVYGAPQWSPDGRKILVVHFGSPVSAGVLDVETGVERPLVFPGYRIHPSPRWAGPDTVVAAATSEEGTAIALFDVANPDDCKVKEVLWKKGDRLDAAPTYPAFSPATGRCAFVAKTPEGLALYFVQRGSFGPPRRLEDRAPDRKLAGLDFSPDGRFLLYCSDRASHDPGGRQTH